MIILLGKSASGKDTIVRKLVEQREYKRIITWTTRPMRPGEKEGVTYHYTSEDEFKKKIKKGQTSIKNLYMVNSLYKWEQSIYYLKNSRKGFSKMTN